MKYRVLAAAIVIELFLGMQYAWAIFDRVLQTEHGFSATETQGVFSATIVAFALAFVAAGRIQDALGPRVTTIIGGVTFGSGLIIAGLGGPRFITIFIGAGVLFGAGIAFGYIGPLATPAKWFPRSKGTATGVVVAAFGLGAFFLGAFAEVLLGRGLSVFATFTVLGVVSLVVIVVLAMFLRVPEGAEQANSRRWEGLPEGILRSGHFWSLVAAFFAGTYAGLTVIGSVKNIGSTLGAAQQYVTASVLVFSIGNASGRAGWGLLFEKLGGRRAIVASLVSQSACLAAMGLAGGSGAVFVLTVFLVGFNYGGCFVLYVTEVAHSYGTQRVGTIYSAIFLVYLVSGMFAPAVSGLSFDTFGSYVPALFSASAVPLAGCAAFVFLFRKEAESSAL